MHLLVLARNTLILLASYAICSNFEIIIPKYSEECFYEQLDHGNRLEISFETSKSTSSDFDVDFIIKNPDGSLLHQVERHRTAAFGFYAGSTGHHEMCFVNKHSSGDKTLAFTFVGPDDQVSVKAPKDASDEETQLVNAVNGLSNELRFMKDEFAFLNRRVERHKQTAESTHSRVFWWSFLQIIIIVAVVGFQVTYLRSTFEKRRMV